MQVAREWKTSMRQINESVERENRHELNFHSRFSGPPRSFAPTLPAARKLAGRVAEFCDRLSELLPRIALEHRVPFLAVPLADWQSRYRNYPKLRIGLH